MTKRDIMNLLEIHITLAESNYFKRFDVSEADLVKKLTATHNVISDIPKMLTIKEGLVDPWMPDISNLPEAYIDDESSHAGYSLFNVSIPNKPDRLLREMKFEYAHMSTPMLRYKSIFYAEPLLTLAQPIIPKAYGKVLIFDAHFGFLAAALDKQKYVTSIDVVCVSDDASEAFVATTLPTLSDKVHLLDGTVETEREYDGYDCIYYGILPARHLPFNTYCWLLWLHAKHKCEVDILGEDTALATAYSNINLGVGDRGLVKDFTANMWMIACVGNYVEYKLLSDGSNLYHKGRVAVKEAIVRYVDEALEKGYTFIKESDLK